MTKYQHFLDQFLASTVYIFIIYRNNYSLFIQNEHTLHELCAFINDAEQDIERTCAPYSKRHKRDRDTWKLCHASLPLFTLLCRFTCPSDIHPRRG